MLTFQDGGGHVIRNPVPANTADPMVCRRGCGGVLVALKEDALTFPLPVACPKCKATHIFLFVGGRLVYGLAL